MSAVLESTVLDDGAPGNAFARDVLAGLSLPQKSIPATWLYDHRGSELFEQITRLPEYHPTRTETWILEHCAAAIAAEAGPGAVVVELGSGSSRKTPLLLGALDTPSAYLPIDISEQFLAESVQALRLRFPALPIEPVVADFSTLQSLPQLAKARAAGSCSSPARRSATSSPTMRWRCSTASATPSARVR